MRPLALALISLLSINSCKKDSPTTPEPVIEIIDSSIPVSSFSQLKVGNYWVFEKYTVDTNGIETDLNSLDTMYVSGDTLINNKIYYIFKRTNWIYNTIQYLRDSSDYIVDQNGGLWFSSTDFSNILQTWVTPFVGTMIFGMEEKGLSISTPAGTFSTYNFKGTYELVPPFDEWGTRYTSKYYAPDVGVVQDSYILSSSCIVYQARLIEYSVN